MPKFSVITVCKNEEKTIEKTILSVLNQQYADVEFIIVDGKSTDKTLDIINKYRDRIDILISETDSGVYSAMNKGIQKATGDFLFFLNGNDTFKDDFVLKKVAKIITDYLDAKLVIGNVDFYENGNYKFTNHQEDVLTIFDFQKKFYSHQGIFYSKSVFEKYGLYNENLRIISDNLLNAKVLKNNELIVYTKDIISNFTLGGLSSNLNYKQLLDKEKKYLHNKMFKYQSVMVRNIISLIKYFLPRVYELYYKSPIYKTYQLKTVIYDKEKI